MFEISVFVFYNIVFLVFILIFSLEIISVNNRKNNKISNGYDKFIYCSSMFMLMLFSFFTIIFNTVYFTIRS